MPFDLKNYGVTYMRAMIMIFHDIIHKEIEVYVENIIIESHEILDHLTDLRKFFGQLKKYSLKLNPSKCAFSISSKK